MAEREVEASLGGDRPPASVACRRWSGIRPRELVVFIHGNGFNEWLSGKDKKDNVNKYVQDIL